MAKLTLDHPCNISLPSIGSVFAVMTTNKESKTTLCAVKLIHKNFCIIPLSKV